MAGMPEGSQRVKVGILLARQVDDLGEWLADAGAFDAAGADALWIHLANVPELDPLAVTAALAAVTARSMLVVVLPTAAGAPPTLASPTLVRTLATIARLSQGRLRIGHDIPSSGPVTAAARAGVDEPRGYELEAAQRWTSVSRPDSRAAWRATLAEAAERGYHGLVVPADPRLIDILRNPDDAGGRMDLHLAQG